MSKSRHPWSRSVKHGCNYWVIGLSSTLLLNFLSISTHDFARRKKPAPSLFSTLRNRWSRNCFWNSRPARNSVIRSISSDNTSLKVRPSFPHHRQTPQAPLLLHHRVAHRRSLPQLQPYHIAHRWLIIQVLQASMPPKWHGSMTLHLLEKRCWDTMDTLNEMFAYEKAAGGEEWASTSPFCSVWPVIRPCMHHWLARLLKLCPPRTQIPIISPSWGE